VVVTLLAMGSVMVFSSSFARGIYGYDDPFYFVLRQVLWIVVGLVAMVVAARIPYSLWERWSIPLMALTLLTLLGVILFGTETFGSTRTFFRGSVQPGEPAKIAIIIYVSAWLASKGSRVRNVQVGLLPFGFLMGLITLLLVAQPEISAAILIVVTASIMFFIAGAELKQLVVVALGGAATFWVIIQTSAYADARVDRYVASIWDPLSSTEWQVTQGLQALLRGGVLGVGVGNGTAKLPGYLPVSWSDNIFAVIGEELGLLGTLLVVLLFALFAYRGFRAALRAPDNFGMLLATGITVQLMLQALLNIAVIVAIAPPTGVTLPFISYGGSSLVTVMGAIGILLSISRANRAAKSGATASELGKLAYARFDFGWGNRRTRLSSDGSSSLSRTGPRVTAGDYDSGRRVGASARSRQRRA
jgi:cell division protein FtsW